MAKGSLNKVILIGNLGADPELRYTPGGQPVSDVRLATNEQWKDKDGNKQDRTEWHRIVLWGKGAEVLKQYANKGTKLYIEGRLQTRSWEDKDKNKRYTTEIVANDFMFLGGGARGPGASAGNGLQDEPPHAGNGMGESVSAGPEDDIPF